MRRSAFVLKIGCCSVRPTFPTYLHMNTYPHPPHMHESEVRNIASRLVLEPEPPATWHSGARGAPHTPALQCDVAIATSAASSNILYCSSSAQPWLELLVRAHEPGPRQDGLMLRGSCGSCIPGVYKVLACGRAWEVDHVPQNDAQRSLAPLFGFWSGANVCAPKLRPVC